MAVLSEQDRAAVHAIFMEEQKRETLEDFDTLTKAEVREAVDALDTWLNDNAAAANQALPVAARTQLTTKQKAQLLTRVIYRRYLAGS